MSDIYTDSPTLTAEQQAVVDQPADAMVLVTAGAGAGKTHTLIRRLDALVAAEGVSVGDILVLTFSRAAVRELRDRLARYGEAARRVRAMTFDSWALDVLMQVDANGVWGNESFDNRIKGAQQAIAKGLTDELYEGLSHVIVDEVQDLVGARRELVETLLDTYDCGFTVVGDLAQSIYGFTVPSEDRVGETGRFFDWLRATFGENLVELGLTENFRARTDDAKSALSIGPRLRDLPETGEVLHAALRSTLHGIPGGNLGKLDQFVANTLAGYPGTTAVLCRDNGQALVISELLYGFGVEHRLQRRAQDRVAPAWIGLLYRYSDGSILSRTRFDELIPDLSLPGGEDPERLWRLLLRTCRGGDRSLDLGRLRTALSTGRLPDELTAQPAARLVVSSFHRAKGLEFDRVVVVDPGPLVIDPPEAAKKGKNRKKPREVDTGEEARLLYVAMTRPRDELLSLDRLDRRLIQIDDQVGRWARYYFQRWRRDGLELLGDDVFTDQPGGMREFDADMAELQAYLVENVRPGDVVVLERVRREAIELKMSPPYLILHGERPIGVVSDHFRSALYRHLKLGPSYEPQNWPQTITSVHIDAVETVSGSEAAGSQAGLGAYGVWLAPRLTGLSRFTFEKKTQEEDPGGEAR